MVLLVTAAGQEAEEDGNIDMGNSPLRDKLFWHLRKNWHLRHQPDDGEVSLAQTVRGLQALLLDGEGTVLPDTLCQVFSRPVEYAELNRLDVAFFQEGREQRVWRAQATLEGGKTATFGLIVARSAGHGNDVTRRDFGHLSRLFAIQPRYCVRPYAQGMAPVAGGLAAYAVEWCGEHRELVFEVSREGGAFLTNSPEAHRHFNPQASRGVWRRIAEVLCWYPELRGVNIQAGDFIGRVDSGGQPDLKLTTARQMVADPSPAEHVAAMLGCMITASGYLSDGKIPFDRHMSRERFLSRMESVLGRRFGDRAPAMARRQWEHFRAGAFARQEDWLKQDCVLGTYDRWRASNPVDVAWRETKERWLAYGEAVQEGRIEPSWWFPAPEIPGLLERLQRRY